MCIMACGFLFKPGEGWSLGCVGLSPSQSTKASHSNSRAGLCSMDGLGKMWEKREKAFFCTPSLGFIASGIAITRIRMKHPGLCPSSRDCIS